MSEKEMPTATGIQIVRALERGGWHMVSQKGHHVRLQKSTDAETFKLTVPAHHPVKRSTLAHILKQARLSVDDFIRLT